MFWVFWELIETIALVAYQSIRAWNSILGKGNEELQMRAPTVYVLRCLDSIILLGSHLPLVL